MTTTTTLLIDPQIRNYCLIPLILVTFLVGVFRSSLRKYLKNDRAQDADKIMHMGRINRAKRLRTNAKYVPREGFEIRKSYLADKDKGILRQKVEIDHTKNPMLNGNPNFMMDMMKGQVFTMLPHIFMMTFVSYVFSGFVLVQIPFPLTDAFRPMLQRGVDIASLDVSYVSSLSWYFLVSFGMNSLYELILGPGNQTLNPMQAQMGMAAGGGAPQQFDPNAPYTREADGLEIMRHDDVTVRNTERKLVGFKLLPTKE